MDNCLLILPFFSDNSQWLLASTVGANFFLKSQDETVLVGKKNQWADEGPTSNFTRQASNLPRIKSSSSNVKSPSDGKRLLKFEFVVPYAGGIIVGCLFSGHAPHYIPMKISVVPRIFPIFPNS